MTPSTSLTHPRAHAWLAAAAVVSIAACGGEVEAPVTDAGADVDAPPAPDAAPPDAMPTLTLALETAAVTAPLDIGVEVDVTIARGGFTGDVEVTLAGAVPGGLAAPALVIPADQTTGTFVVWVDDAAPTGALPLTLSASAPDDAAVAEATLTLTLDALAPGFAASLESIRYRGAFDPTFRARRQLWTVPGWTAPVEVHAVALDGYAGAPIARWEDLEGGLSGEPTPLAWESLTAAEITAVATATLPLVAATDAPLGTRELRIVVSDGTLRQELFADLRVAGAGLDPIVGDAGRVTPFGDAVIGLDLDSTGRVFVVRASAYHQIEVTRLTADGALDPTFGDAGVVTIEAPDLENATAAVVASPGGAERLYVAGGVTPPVLLRLTTDGALDPTFGGEGHVNVTALSGFTPRALRVRPTGKIVLVGDVGGQPAVARLEASGAPDATFGTDGLVRLPVSSGQLTDLVMDGGDVIAVGIGSPSANPDVLVARLDGDGQLVASFGGDGCDTFDVLSSDASAHGVALAPDGDVLVAGAFYSGGGFVLRLEPTGSPDFDFGGGDGVIVPQLSTDGLERLDVASVRASASGITLYGTRSEDHATPARPYALRVDDTGAPDATFGAGGAVWMLGGDARSERVTGVRVTPTGTWITADATGGESTMTTLMRMTATGQTP